MLAPRRRTTGALRRSHASAHRRQTPPTALPSGSDFADRAHAQVQSYDQPPAGPFSLIVAIESLRTAAIRRRA